MVFETTYDVDTFACITIFRDYEDDNIVTLSAIEVKAFYKYLQDNFSNDELV